MGYSIHGHVFLIQGREVQMLIKQRFINSLISFNCKRRISVNFHMSRVMRKPDFCICENKGAVTAKLINLPFFTTRIYNSSS